MAVIKTFGSQKTFGAAKPLTAEHWEYYDCPEAECDWWLNGWKTFSDEATELGQEQAKYIRTASMRHFREERLENGLTLFVFEPGQRCFRSPHRMPNGRPGVWTQESSLGRMRFERSAELVEAWNDELRWWQPKRG